MKSRRARTRTLTGAALAALAGWSCARRVADTPRPAVAGRTTTQGTSGGEVTADAGRVARIALSISGGTPTFVSNGDWELRDETGRPLVTGIVPGARWTIERRGGEVRAVGEGRTTPWKAGAIVARPLTSETYMSFDGHRWRGELWTHSSTTGMTVVNRVGVEEYLRGVVPLELNLFGTRDIAALEAQAVAARSYAYSRMPEFEPRDVAIRHAALPYDLRATVSDQVYGGVDAENVASDRAIANTAGLVLRYNGAVVSAPYHSACGGSTAEPSELWKSQAEPYLRRVSDKVPGTSDRYYCDIAPRFHWTRTWDEAELRGVLERYLRSPDARAQSGRIGAVASLDVESRTGSGRVDVLRVASASQNSQLRGNDIRFAVRTVGGEILPSTYFSVNAEHSADGQLSRVTIRGNGNGHGVGMCQWGAVGRARAGQSFRSILRAYFPGTTIDPVE